MLIAFASLRAAEPISYGLMVLGAILRHHGHQVRIAYGKTASDIVGHREIVNADVVALSAPTGLHRVYLDWVRALRRRYPEKGLFLGGPHATFFPQVIEEAPLDAVCIGEGEDSFPRALELYRDGFPEVPRGFWIRRDHGRGPVEKGSEQPPVRCLDGLPTPAYDLFYDDPYYEKLPARVFLATRGCPYRCTYCFNRTLNERYQPYGRLVRTRDPEQVCDEILAVKKRWGLEITWFLDANFASDKRWLDEFTEVYKRRVTEPYFCKLRPERATDRVVRALASSGCVAVGLGIECGTERLRREVLGRVATDADILAGCGRLKARGIRILGFNMVAIPGETFDDALRTLALNVACGVDHAGATMLQPYPGTAIAQWAIEHGHFDGRFDRLGYSYFDPTPFRFSPADRSRFTNLARLFSLACEFPEVRRRIRWLTSLRLDRLYRHLFTARHDWMMRHYFYAARKPLPPRFVGRTEDHERALHELRVA